MQPFSCQKLVCRGYKYWNSFSSINFSTKHNPTTKLTQTSFRIAFGEVSSEEQIQKAIKALDCKEIEGRRLVVKHALKPFGLQIFTLKKNFKNKFFRSKSGSNICNFLLNLPTTTRDSS